LYGNRRSAEIFSGPPKVLRVAREKAAPLSGLRPAEYATPDYRESEL
jgi:hypothetical protein